MYIDCSQVLYRDIQMQPVESVCPACGCERYGSYPCLRCERRLLWR